MYHKNFLITLIQKLWALTMGISRKLNYKAFNYKLLSQAFNYKLHHFK